MCNLFVLFTSLQQETIFRTIQSLYEPEINSEFEQHDSNKHITATRQYRPLPGLFAPLIIGELGQTEDK